MFFLCFSFDSSILLFPTVELLPRSGARLKAAIRLNFANLDPNGFCAGVTFGANPLIAAFLTYVHVNRAGVAAASMAKRCKWQLL
jgi:hypothetical protein